MRVQAFRGGSSGAAPAPAPSGFAAVFPTAYQILQFDLGLLYGSVPKPTAGNTATTIPSLSGVIAGVPVPIWIVATNSASIGSGATFAIYYDGGVTPAMSGVTPTAGTPVALTGAGLGMSVTFTAGTSVTANSWKATCAGIVDQSGNNKDSLCKDNVAGEIAAQPIVTVGLNGKPGLLFDGVANQLSSLLALPAPGTTPWCGGIVVRRPTTAAANARMLSGVGDNGSLIFTGPTDIRLYNGGAFGPTGTGLATNTWGAVDFKFSNSANDYIQCGSGPQVLGAGALNAVPTGMSIIGTGYANVEILAVLYAPASGWSSSTFRSMVTTLHGGSVNV